jgi:hypothetical protein
MAQNENEIKVFLASSSELELERLHVGDLFNDINSILTGTNVRVRLLKWENFNPSFTGERKQSEYDEQVKNADVFVALFRSTTGKFTLEEAETAMAAHAHDKRPEELYCFIQNYEKRDSDFDKKIAEISEACVMDSFSGINDLKLKLLKILTPRLNAYGVTVSETDKFIQIDSVNIFRKQE